MTDVRQALSEAFSAPVRELDFDRLVQRAALRRRLTAAAAVAGSALAVAALAVTLSTASTSSQLHLTPADRGGGGTGPAPKDDHGSATTVPAPRRSPGALAPTNAGRAQQPDDVIPSSAGGYRVAFSRDGGVYVAVGGSRSATVVLSHGHSAAWSPDSKRLAATALLDEQGNLSSSGVGNLVVMDADGANRVLVRSARASADSYEADSPAWSPDGSRIAFVQRYCKAAYPGVGTPGQPCQAATAGADSPQQVRWSEVWSMRADGSDAHVVYGAGGPGFYESPSWSPDGRRLVFSHADAGRKSWNLAIVDADGSHFVSLTNNTTSASYDPAWSPDGRWIAFAFSEVNHGVPTCAAGSSGISVTSVDGTIQASITPAETSCDDEPAFAPDRDLYFTRHGDNNPYAGALWLKYFGAVHNSSVDGTFYPWVSGAEASIVAIR